MIAALLRHDPALRPKILFVALLAGLTQGHSLGLWAGLAIGNGLGLTALPTQTIKG